MRLLARPRAAARTAADFTGDALFLRGGSSRKRAAKSHFGRSITVHLQHWSEVGYLLGYRIHPGL